MIVTRNKPSHDGVRVSTLPVESPDVRTILGDNRELMRHGDGALHAGVVDLVGDRPRLFLYGARTADDALARLGDAVGSESGVQAEPATDSNHNGAYVAYTEADGKRGRAGYVVTLPDPFGDPEHRTVHGPLTPEDADVRGTFLQASRKTNSVAYGWRDDRTNTYLVGVSPDGREFPPAVPVVSDVEVVSGPSVGIRGEYVLVVFGTSDARFAPEGAEPRPDATYYAWLESGDAGATWTKPQPLFADRAALPTVAGYSLDRGLDLVRHDVELSGIGTRDGSLQGLVWEPPGQSVDTRVFAMTAVAPQPTDSDWGRDGNLVGVLSFKQIAVGGEWTHVLTNRVLFRRGDESQPYDGRVGRQYKYGALPGTAVRSIAYVEKSPAGSELEDQVVILVSTTMGDSFDYESTFSASDLGFEPDADLVISNSACCLRDAKGNVLQDLFVGDLRRTGLVRHATLPIGFNVQEVDESITW